MSDTVIRVEGLGKKFKIGSQQPYHRFSELITGLGSAALNAPKRWLTAKPSTSQESPSENPNEFWALRDINFEVKQGDVVGIIGRNGAGKSTLLKILSRITEPTEGRFGIKGRVASLLEVGTGFHPELTGRENIYLSGSVLGMSRAEIKARFDEIVDFAGVDKFLDTPVKRYSSGMQVRLGFAVAAHLEPEILIVDEVLAVGDAEFQKKCLGKMGEVSKSGRTILFVSHNMGAMRQLCTTAILLKEGMIEIESNDVVNSIDCYFAKHDERSSNDLSLRKDRSGNGLVTIKNIAVRSKCSNKSISSGEDVVIECQLKAKTLSHFFLAIDIYNYLQYKVCQLNTEAATGRLIQSQRGEFTITFQLDALPLTQGKYTASVFIRANGDISDWIHNVHSFTVLEGDFYGTGRLPPDRQGDFYPRFQCTITSSQD